ncbi:hypothetical protein ACQEUU_11935 [Nonomuraea sp. CA-218870]|uniref:hypothetical protein n=1 Tax=Nonomuraea sp. CA-218870 TaxID=3239998 RepID=UPI003D8A8277
MREVPRHLFIPPVALAGLGGENPRLIDREADPRGWWDAVYSDNPIITQLDDGATDIGTAPGDSTSSCSAPGIVAQFLELLDPEPGTQVLEIGTGTGWTAALLCHLVGAANVATT